MSAVIHDLQQGTPDWVAFRARHYGASEAAAMLGLSKHTTRAQLLRQKHTGLSQEHSDWVQEHVLDHGYRVEAQIRPHMEQVIGDDLYPVTCSKPGTRLSASCDGLTLAGDTAWENKQWNEQLAASVRAGIVPEDHMPQCQQILLVTAAQRVVFSVTDGTPEGTVWAEVRPDAAWFERIERGWAKFEQDLAAYVPEPIAPAVTAAPQEHLPAVSVQVSGALAVASNLRPFGEALRAFVAKIPRAPSTDQEFADTEAACKRLKEAEDRLQAAEDGALASMANVETMRRTVAELRDLARSTRLASEKVVKARKEQIRADEVQRGRSAVAAHFKALCDRLGGPYLAPVQADFPGVIKGLKTLESVRNAVDTEVARLKIDLSSAADRVDANLKTITAAGAPHLFADRAALAQKAPDDLAAVIAQLLAAEERRQEQERERIRQQEAERLEREQEEALIASLHANSRRIESDTVAYIEKAAGTYEIAMRDWINDPRPRVREAAAEGWRYLTQRLFSAQQREEAERQAQADREAQAAQPTPKPAVEVLAEASAKGEMAHVVIEGAGTSIAVGGGPAQPVRGEAAPSAITAAMDAPTIKLGDLKQRLGFPLGADFIAGALDVHGKRDGTSWLYTPRQLAGIKARLLDHIERVL